MVTIMEEPVGKQAPKRLTCGSAGLNSFASFGFRKTCFRGCPSANHTRCGKPTRHCVSRSHMVFELPGQRQETR